MAIVARDQGFAGEQVRWLRRTLRLSLENLADAAGVTILAAEKAESGRHKPDEQTLRAIAEAAGVDVSFFARPATDGEAQRHAAVRNALKLNAMIPLKPLRAAADILGMLDERRRYRLETPRAARAALEEQAEALLHQVREMDAHWAAYSISERLGQAARLAETCAGFQESDHSCWFGSFPRRRRTEGRSIRETVGLIAVRAGQSPAKAQFARVRIDDDGAV